MLRVMTLMLLSLDAFASQVTVNVTSNKGNPVFQAVVYLEPESPSLSVEPIDDVSVMDQIDRQFVPHILPVQKGANVVFPNSDSIKHHVYSFSPTKRFELKLYRGSDTEELTFENTGEVELGCNVHDWMLAYIWVVDTPFFSKTNQQGKVTLTVPNGNYRLKVWHPRIQDNLDELTQAVVVESDTEYSIALNQDLLSDLSLFEDQTDGFSDYD